MHVEKKYFNKIQCDGKILKRSDIPVIGGVAQSLKSNNYLTEKKYYLIGDFIWKDGKSTSIIGDDGEPCGLHKCFTPNSFLYYV